MNRIAYAFFWMEKRKYLFIIGILLQGFVSFLSMYLIADFISGITLALVEKRYDSIANQMLTLVMGYLVVITLILVGTMLVAEASLYATKKLRGRIVEMILLAKVDCLNGRSSEEVINAFTSEINSIFDNLAKVAAIPVNILFVGGGGFLYTFSLDRSTGILIMLFGVGKLIYGLLFAKKMKQISKEMLDRRLDYTSSVKQLMDHPVSIRMFAMEDVLHPQYMKGTDNIRVCNIKYGEVSGILGAINNITSEAFTRLLLFDLGNAVFKGSYGLSDMMKEKEIATNAMGVFSISRILTDAQIVLTATERVIEFTKSLEPEVTGDYRGDGLNTSYPYVLEFDRVAFRYRDKLLWKNLTFQVPRGSITVIRGDSGTGKTTILRLAQGIYQPEAGLIKALGITLQDWNHNSLRERIAYVPQQALFFEGTVGENITGRLGDVCLDRVIEAAKEALIYDKIMELPHGFHTYLIDNDSRFSGGEQKRLMLARAFFKRVEFLLLDELTAAVDLESEKMIYEILRNRRGKQTVLFATHRVLAEQIADQIIEL